MILAPAELWSQILLRQKRALRSQFLSRRRKSPSIISNLCQTGRLEARQSLDVVHGKEEQFFGKDYALVDQRLHGGRREVTLSEKLRFGHSLHRCEYDIAGLSSRAPALRGTVAINFTSEPAYE